MTVAGFFFNKAELAAGGTPATTAAIVDHFGALEVEDDAICLEFPTSTEPITLTVEDMDGALGAMLDPPRSIVISTSASTGTYSTDPWTITSTALDDSTVTDTPALLQANGNEQRETLKVHSTMVTIQIPAMNDENGLIKIGVGSRVGLRHKPLKTTAGQPYVQAHSSGIPMAEGTWTTVAASGAGAPPYGAVDLTGLLDGFAEYGASYVKDLS